MLTYLFRRDFSRARIHSSSDSSCCNSHLLPTLWEPLLPAEMKACSQRTTSHAQPASLCASSSNWRRTDKGFKNHGHVTFFSKQPPGDRRITSPRATLPPKIPHLSLTTLWAVLFNFISNWFIFTIYGIKFQSHKKMFLFPRNNQYYDFHIYPSRDYMWELLYSLHYTNDSTHITYPVSCFFHSLLDKIQYKNIAFFCLWMQSILAMVCHNFSTTRKDL